MIMSKPNWIGQTLGGRYDIRELIGQGGMSAVYKAYDPNLRRVVALKLIHAHLSSDPEFVRRFQEEGAAVAQLRHNNIIQVYDFNHDGDTYYIVFEFIPGESLQARLKRLADTGQQMPYDQTVEIAANITDALHYAHTRGLIHRDIKPANVMLNVQGQAILMDFGIVKIMGGDSHTATGAVLGTARYMAPEQIKGEQVTGRADIYAVGVMLYEMVGGRPPFKADSAMTLMMMHVNDPIPDLRHLRPSVPTDLVQIINKALAKDPNQRYQSAAELAQALRSARLTAPSEATAVTPVIDATQIEQPVFSPPPPGATLLEPSPVRPPTAAHTQPPAARAPAAQSPPPVPASTGKSSSRRLLLFGGIGLAMLLLFCLIIGAVALNAFGNTQEETPIAAEETATVEAEVTTTIAVIAEATTAVEETGLTSTATTQPPPTTTPSPSNTPTPTATSEPTNTPTPTLPPGPYVQINGITIENGRYSVAFETFEYTPINPGMHIHFFFNTVPPENAGVGPNQQNWFVYYDGSPFTGYALTDRPGGATQMCALVANQNHTIILETGNCVNLPES
jgi:serine/threonine-protein kinase